MAQALRTSRYLCRQCAIVLPPAIRAALCVNAIVITCASGSCVSIPALSRSRKCVFPTPAGPIMHAPPFSTTSRAMFGRCSSRPVPMASGMMSRSFMTSHRASRSSSCTTVQRSEPRVSWHSSGSGRRGVLGTLLCGFSTSRTRKRDSPVESESVLSSASCASPHQSSGGWIYRQSTQRPMMRHPLRCVCRSRLAARRFKTSA